MTTMKTAPRYCLMIAAILAAGADSAVAQNLVNPVVSDSSNNTAMGSGALPNQDPGRANTAAGEGALAFNTGATDYSFAGSFNTAVGTYALLSNSGTTNGDGSFNSALGFDALNGNQTGSNNTAI